MKNTLVAFILLCSAATTLAAESSHCKSSEKVIFNCQINNSPKVVSLCGSSDLSDKAGYLQYRFGRPGNVELEFPKDRNKSREQFRWAHYARFQTDRTEISFENGGYKYTLYDYYDGDQEPPTAYGVRVGKTAMSCADPVINELPKLRLEQVIPCDEKSPLNLMGCE